LFSGTLYYLVVPSYPQLKNLSFLISPQEAAVSTLKAVMSIVFLTVGYAGITLIVEGPMGPINRIKQERCDSAMSQCFWATFWATLPKIFFFSSLLSDFFAMGY
jgi:hypothetical protein